METSFTKGTKVKKVLFIILCLIFWQGNKSEAKSIENELFKKPEIEIVKIPLVKNFYEHKGTFTCYNSLASQTDDTPRITASGQQTRTGIIANNYYPFGTKIQIEGLGEYEVQDRMAKRYDINNWDLWMEDYSGCLQFGVRKLDYKIIK